MDNYSAEQFIKDCQRMCKGYNNAPCDICPMGTLRCYLPGITETEIAIVHQWAKDHPIEVKEESKEMTKADLKTGMIVELRNGIKFTLFLNTLPFTDIFDDYVTDFFCNGSKREWSYLEHYNDDLTFFDRKLSEYDIIKIYQPSHPYSMQDLTYDFENWTLLWQRPEPKEEKPVKTYAQDFFEKFPNAQKETNGTPKSCTKLAYGEGVSCYGYNPMTCEECWNRPVEGKG